MAAITRGALEQILKGVTLNLPVVAVQNITSIKTSNGDERYKITLTDGTTESSAMLATQLNSMVASQKLQVDDLVVLQKYICNEVGSRKVIIVLQLVGKSNPGNQQVPLQPVHSTSAVKQPMGAVRQYGAPQMQQPKPQQQVFSGKGPVARQQHGSINYMPIKTMNPYSKWIIKARCSSKSDIRTWDKGPTNQGKLFSCEVADENGGEIRMTFFREAVDTFYPMIQVGGVYSFANGKLKMANKQFSAVDCDYEITFGNDAEIVPLDDDHSISTVSLQPVNIHDIASKPPNVSIDVLGIVTEVGPVSDFTSKAGKPLTKVEIVMLDKSEASIRATVWGERAREVNNEIGGRTGIAIGLKGCRISDWGGRTLNTSNGSVIHVQPNIPQAVELERWFNEGGAGNGNFVALSSSSNIAKGDPKKVHERFTLASLTDCKLGEGEKPDYAEVQASIAFVKSDKLWYFAAPEEGNNKKVTQVADGQWHCEGNNAFYATKENRYIASVTLADFTGQMWTTAFNESAIQILGHDANEMESWMETDEAKFKSIIADSTFKPFVFKLRIKDERGSDGTVRKKATIVSATPIDYLNESKLLLEAIARFD